MGGYKNSITDINGKVGVGVVSPTERIQIYENGLSSYKTYSATNAGAILTSYQSQGSPYTKTTDLVAGSDGTVPSEIRLFTRTNGSSSITERMRIDSSGNVGIGALNPYGWSLRVEKTNSQFLSLLNTSGNGTRIQMADQSFSGEIEQNSGSLLFKTGGSTERMRITSGGNVLIGTTAEPNGTSVYGSGFVPSSTDRSILKMATSNVNASTLAIFYNPNGQVGSILTNGSATSYSTSSDYRLKENVVPMEGALDRVDALKPSRFNFIADPEKTVDGFLAHEVAEVIPEAISGEKDAMEEYEVTPAQYETVIIQEAVEATYDEEGNELTPAQEAITEQKLVSEAVMGTRPVYQGIDQSKIVPLLVGAIQELRAEIQALKANNSLT